MVPRSRGAPGALPAPGVCSRAGRSYGSRAPVALQGSPVCKVARCGCVLSPLPRALPVACSYLPALPAPGAVVCTLPACDLTLTRLTPGACSRAARLPGARLQGSPVCSRMAPVALTPGAHCSRAARLPACAPVAWTAWRGTHSRRSRRGALPFPVACANTPPAWIARYGACAPRCVVLPVVPRGAHAGRCFVSRRGALSCAGACDNRFPWLPVYSRGGVLMSPGVLPRLTHARACAVPGVLYGVDYSRRV